MKRGMGDMKREKKAQFYLIAAAIIITIIVGIAVLLSYKGNKPKEVIAYDLADELGLETSKVIDYGIYHGENTTGLIENFSSEYILEYGRSKANMNWYLVYGDNNSLYVVNYTMDLIGGMELGKVRFPVSRIVKKEGIGEIRKEDGQQYYDLIIDGETYTFEINPGKVFYFVLEEYVEGERHVVPG